MSTVLGIHAPFTSNNHDPNVTLVIDGVTTFASEEERYNRNKTSLALFPEKSLDNCLRFSSLDIQDIDVLAIDGVKARFLDLKVSRYIMTMYGYTPPIKKISHPIAHGCGAFYSSGYDYSLVVSVDGQGDGLSILIYSESFSLGPKSRKVYYSQKGPISLGTFYSAFTNFLGFRSLEGEYKLMGMAAFGDPEAFDLSSYNSFDSDTGRVIQDHSFLDLDMHSSPFETHCNPQQISSFTKLNPVYPFSPLRTSGHFDLAASVQKNFEDVYICMISHYSKIAGTRNVCISGGSALNCLANMKLINLGYNVYVQPAASDRGLSMGSAYEVASQLGDVILPPRNMFLGMSYDNQIIERSLLNSGLNFAAVSDIYSWTAQHLVDGAVIGWFQNRSEFGPRALGSRSIIASASKLGNRDLINQKIKYREEFRPFAPAILLSDYRELSESNLCHPFMTDTVKVSSQLKHYIPECCHNDDTARVQTVDTNNPSFFDLLSAIKSITGVGCCINTSFNLSGEPIVETPADAIRTFVSSGLDYLCIGEFVVSKNLPI